MVWIAAIVAGLIGISGSSPAPADEQHERCMAAGQTTLDYEKCGSEWVAREDAELNRVWRRVYGGLESRAVKRDLLAEQRRWVKYKESSCLLFRNREEFGSIGWALQFPTCRAGVIRERTDRLRQYSDQIEGQAASGQP